MKLLTREALLDTAKNVRIEPVVLDEKTKDGVFIKEMTGEERNQFEKMLVKQVGQGEKTTFQNTLDNFREKLCVMSICDEDGKLMFKPSDFRELGKLPAMQLDKIVAASKELNKISQSEKEAEVKN
jgi:hypothetical protein